MKISKLTKLTGYSRNTIQYYTCIGLLMPLQKGADHDYTQREVDDLAYIEKLKAMSFSIKISKQSLDLKDFPIGMSQQLGNLLRHFSIVKRIKCKKE